MKDCRNAAVKRDRGFSARGLRRGRQPLGMRNMSEKEARVSLTPRGRRSTSPGVIHESFGEQMWRSRYAPPIGRDLPAIGEEDAPTGKTATAPALPADGGHLVLDNSAILALSEVARVLAMHRYGAGAAGLVSSLLNTLAEYGSVDVLLAPNPSRERDRTDAMAYESLIQHMSAQAALPSEGAVRQAQRNAEARAELLDEFGAMTGEEIGEQHSRARNRHALAARWRKEQRLFSVPHQGRALYPRFQFDRTSGTLRPAIRDVLAALPTDRMSDWEVALWWTASNGWLGGSRPVDLLDDGPDEVVAAAARLGEPSPL